MIGKLLTLAAFLGLAQAELYDPNHSDVMLYTKLNWDKQVMSKRDKGISIVHFYNEAGKFSLI